MTCSCSSSGAVGDVMSRLKTAASAEEFFAILAVPYAPEVVNVSRLHILKRMGEYLASEDVEGLPDAVAAARCKAVLERAYEEFATSSPLEKRVFKVLKQAVAPKPPKNFVPLEDLE